MPVATTSVYHFRPGGGLPSGVSLQQIDGGPSYWSAWTDSFPNSIVPVGVFPAASLPADLSAMGINFFTPMRDDNAGTWCPVASNPDGDDMTHVNATAGFYAGAAFYGPTWGARAVFNVFGDELDGNGISNWFDCAPASVSSNNQTGTWGSHPRCL